MDEIDIKLVLNEDDGYYDIDFASNGDFLMTNGLETAIFMTVLAERRADESEITSADKRRGDWSNESNDINEYEVGSKFWLIDQARILQETINVGIDSLESGFEWMADDDIIKEVNVDGDIIDNSMFFTIELSKQNNKTETFIYDAFKNTLERAS